MASKLVKGVVVIVGFALLAIFVLYYVWEGSKVINIGPRGTFNSSFHFTPDGNVTVVRVDSTDFVSPPYPDSGDIILMVDGITANRDSWGSRIRSAHRPGHEAQVLYASDRDTLQTLLRIRPVPAGDIWLFAVLEIVRFLLTLSYLAVGLWAYFKRPESGAVRALTLFCFAMAASTIAAITVLPASLASLSIPYLDTALEVVVLLSLLFGAFWLNLQLLFPRPRSFIVEYPHLAYLLCYLPVPVLAAVLAASGWQKMSWALPTAIAVQVMVGFYLLGRHYDTAEDLLEKRQTRLVLWGTGVGLSGLLILLILVIFASNWLTSWGTKGILILFTAIFLLLLLSPLSFAYSFGRYRLLEVEGKIRRGTRYVATTVVLLVVFYLLIYAVSELLLDTFGSQSRAPVLLLALLLAVGFTPVQRRAQSLVESKIYPERSRLKSMLNDFLRQSLEIADEKDYFDELRDRLREVLKVEVVEPVLHFEDREVLYRTQGRVTPFRVDSELVKELRKVENRPLMLDEALASEKVLVDAAEQAWLRENDIALILPMTTPSRFVGFLAIGSKSGREDFEAADIDILQSLASQAAVASENMMLLEENVEKRRLEDQLSMARRIQEGLLPRQIPSTPGLLVAARSRFCLEVAGDYYDIVNLDVTRTVLAVGDVSGKGAGAALLMSNLQASLRTAVRARIRISELVGQINDLIFENTPPEQFITFFVGVYDDDNSTLSYVNAGHNPPLLIRSGGGVETLEAGGLILGALSGMPYEEGTVSLGDGDLIFLYTDGVTEAENSEEEMYGEGRLREFLEVNIERSPEEILTGLEEEVKSFAGEVPFSDDFTLLAVRVSEKRR
jgi:serine phosphatase RsbU (regulator of sigma subunit)